MKKILFILLFIASVSFGISAEGTLTYNGRKIIIYDNFTWKYADSDDSKAESMSLNINNENKTLINSSNGKYGVYYNGEKWQKTSGLNDQAEIQFKNEDNTGFAMIIYDGLKVSLESMKKILIMNANRIDKNAKIISTEECSIGALSGELVKYTASSAGMNFIFYTFITTNPKGTIQFTCFTLDSEFDNLLADFNDLISGFVF